MRRKELQDQRQTEFKRKDTLIFIRLRRKGKDSLRHVCSVTTLHYPARLHDSIAPIHRMQGFAVRTTVHIGRGIIPEIFAIKTALLLEPPRHFWHWTQERMPSSSHTFSSVDEEESPYEMATLPV
jgi:hypothetical protein